MVEGPHVLRAIKVILSTNVQLALNETDSTESACLLFLFCKFHVQETGTSFLHVCHRHKSLHPEQDLDPFIRF